MRYAPGAIGNDAPLTVSPQHRILLEGSPVQIGFAAEAVLAPARSFLGAPGVSLSPAPRQEYHHVLLERHALVESAGAATESLHPGRTALRALDPVLRLDLMRVLGPGGVRGYGPTAAPCLTVAEGAALLRWMGWPMRAA